MNSKRLMGLIALIVAVAYVAIPYDLDTAWYGYIDDFFVFMAGYTFFMSTRSASPRTSRLLAVLSGTLFIVGMLALIALILFA